MTPQLPLVGDADQFLAYFNYRVTHTEGCRIKPQPYLYPTIREAIGQNAQRLGWDQMQRLADVCAANDYLNGRSGKRPCIATLYWIMQGDHCEAILSGRYDNNRVRPDAFAQQCRDEAHAELQRRIRDMEKGRGGLRAYLQQKLDQGLPLTDMDRQRLALLSESDK